VHLEYHTEKKRNCAAEKKANEFAMKTLLGQSGMAPFRGLTRDQDDQDIAATVMRLKIAPGAATHQKHQRRMLEYRYGNSLCVDLSGSFSVC